MVGGFILRLPICYTKDMFSGARAPRCNGFEDGDGAWWGMGEVRKMGSQEYYGILWPILFFLGLDPGTWR